jgi:8-oxo-dGTP pyrophosphatase MutT (NUDIX family)
LSVAHAFDLSTAARLGDPWLEPTADLSRAFHLLDHFEPVDEAQAEFQRRMLELIQRHPQDAHRRTLLEGHLTASALVVDAQFERALLTHHKKLGRWLQLGGHCDGDANLAHVALREAVEEGGIADLVVLPTPLDLDIHPIPARPGTADRAPEPEHLHYDTRFLVVAPPGAIEVLSDESHALRWVAPDELEQLSTDASVRRLFQLVFGS